MSLFGDNLKNINQLPLFGNSNGNNKNGILSNNEDSLFDVNNNSSST